MELFVLEGVFFHGCKWNGAPGCSVDVGWVRTWWETLVKLITQVANTLLTCAAALSRQACATQTTSAFFPSPLTTDRLASWSHMTPVRPMLLFSVKYVNILLSSALKQRLCFPRFRSQHVWWRGQIQNRSSGWSRPIQPGEALSGSEPCAHTETAETVRTLWNLSYMLLIWIYFKRYIYI